MFLLIYGGLAIVKYRSFHSGIDLGIFTQALSSGRLGLPDGVEGGSHFAFHFSPVLFLCVPVLALFRSPLALQIVQAVAGAFVAPAVYRIARRSLPARSALVLACAALAYPPLAAVTFVDFHENGFVAPVVLWLAWAVLERRFALAAGLAAAMLAIKEDEALVLAAASIVTAAWSLRAGDRALAIRCGIACAISLAVFVAYFAWLQPLAAGGRPWDPLRFYAATGRGAQTVVPYLSVPRVGYVLEAFYPLLFTPLLSRRIVYAIPGLLEDVLSRQSLPFSMNSHYPAVWLPWVLFAAIDGVAVARRRWSRVPNLATGVLVVCAGVLIFSSPTHWKRYLSWPSAHDAALQRRLDALPPALKIATQDEIFSHLGMRANARVGLDWSREAIDAVLVDDTRAGDSYFVPLFDRALARRDSGFVLVDRRDGISLYRRRDARGIPHD